MISEEEIFYALRDMRWDLDALDGRLASLEVRVEAIDEELQKQAAKAARGRQKLTREERADDVERKLLALRDRVFGKKTPPDAAD